MSLPLPQGLRNFTVALVIDTGMDVMHTSSKSESNLAPARGQRKLPRWPVALAIGLVLVGIFYIEENWRGRRAWENCKRDIRASGVELKWANYIPAEIPENQNVFGVPEMQWWFEQTGGGWNNLAAKLPSLYFAGVSIDSNTPRVAVAEVVIGQPDKPAPNGFAALRWDDPAARGKAAQLLTNALGPTARAPQSSIGVGLMLRRAEQIQPAQIFLQCKTPPKDKELEAFLPDTILHADTGLPERVLKFETDGSDSYRVTMPVLGRAADFLAWSDGLEPQFALIRQALQRPSSRMSGFYGNPSRVPGPNFKAIRALVQTLGARAQCHLLLGEPGKALDDLTLANTFSHRVLEEHKPMSLLAAMINVAVEGANVDQIAEGLQWHRWGEHELAALQEQLSVTDVIPSVKQAFLMEAVNMFDALESVPSAGLVKRSSLSGLCPSGWGYQHIATQVRFEFERLVDLDTTNQAVLADKVKAAGRAAETILKGSPYKFAEALQIAPMTFGLATQRAARVQTTINQTIIACALERYRLAHGEYPETLDALVPQFLEKIPHNVIGGGRPNYHRAAEGAFVLYSTGWNGLDKGGASSQPSSSPDVDWVWPK